MRCLPAIFLFLTLSRNIPGLEYSCYYSVLRVLISIANIINNTRNNHHSVISEVYMIFEKIYYIYTI